MLYYIALCYNIVIYVHIRTPGFVLHIDRLVFRAPNTEKGHKSTRRPPRDRLND